MDAVKVNLIRAVLWFGWLWAAGGCEIGSGDRDDASQTPPSEPVPLQTPADSGTTELEVSSEMRTDPEAAEPALTQVATGTLEGTITLGGTLTPLPTRVMNSTDPEVCGTEHSLQEVNVSEENRGIRNVIVSLADVPEDRVPSRGPERLVIDNLGCQFIPHVAVATVGDTIVALNSDSMLHTTHYYGPMRGNVALAMEGMAVSRVAAAPGLVTVLCDVHGWMRAYLRIDPHPFHVVTDVGGRYRVEGIPPGSHTLELWHERLGERRVEVEIEPGSVTTVDMEYPPTDA